MTTNFWYVSFIFQICSWMEYYYFRREYIYLIKSLGNRTNHLGFFINLMQVLNGNIRYRHFRTHIKHFYSLICIYVRIHVWMFKYLIIQKLMRLALWHFEHEVWLCTLLLIKIGQQVKILEVHIWLND